MVLCLVYVGWIIYLGDNEFDKINTQYRRVVGQLDEGLMRASAIEELIAECRSKEYKVLADRNENNCLSWPPLKVEAKVKEVEKRQLRAKERAGIKRMLFYISFVVIFLLTPPLMMFLFISAIIKVYSNIKFIR